MIFEAARMTLSEPGAVSAREVAAPSSVIVKTERVSRFGPTLQDFYRTLLSELLAMHLCGNENLIYGGIN